MAIGLNYRDHIEETGSDPPASPLVFAKYPSAVIGPGEPIVVDHQLAERVDWEVELGVVIGKADQIRSRGQGPRGGLRLHGRK